jgi:hypothetical protein
VVEGAVGVLPRTSFEHTRSVIRDGYHDRLETQRHEILGRSEARADSRLGTQRLVSYLVRTTPSGNVRVSRDDAQYPPRPSEGSVYLARFPSPKNRGLKWGAMRVTAGGLLESASAEISTPYPDRAGSLGTLSR